MMERCEHYTIECKKEEMTCKGCAYNKKSADELFDEAGYRKLEEDVYEQKEYPYNEICFENERVKLLYDIEELTAKEVKAIYRRMEEKGWK